MRDGQALAADDFQACANGSDDAAIAACTRAIASGNYRGRELAALYENRGYAWVKNFEHDRATADYTEAIRLDPKLALAYYNRGVIWEVRHNLQNALADFK